MSRSSKAALLGVIPLLAGWFIVCGLYRFIDGDEGFYLLASRLVLLHRVPYIDFLYVQMPLLPYVYAGWLKVFGISWVAARMLAALLSTVLGLLIFVEVCRQTRRWQAGLAAVGLYAFCTNIFSWYPVAKTYSLSMLLLFAAYVIVARLREGSSPWLPAAAGVLFGLSIDTRLYLVAVAPVFLWWLVGSKPPRLARGLYFIAGIVAGLLPAILLFAAAPRRFLFNNLGYHALRSGVGIISAWGQKARALWYAMFGLGDTGLQLTMLALAACFFVIAVKKWRSGAAVSMIIAAVLGVVSILPTPVNSQYWCVCVPFLIMALVGAGSEYLDNPQSQTAKSRTAVLACLLAVVYFGLGAFGAWNHLVTGEYLIGVAGPKDAPNWTLPQVRSVSKMIDGLALPNEEVASFWPGYLFEAQALPFHGFENDFGRVVSDRLTAEERARYDVISSSELETNFAVHVPRLVVVGNQTSSGGGRAHAAIQLRHDGYELVASPGYTLIYEYPAVR